MLISFDVWNTLINSNPEYKIKRKELISKYTHEYIIIDDVFNTVKKEFDNLVERFGVHFESKMLYDVIFDELNIEHSKREYIIRELNELFIEYPPLIYSDDTVKVLEKLKSSGHRLIIISNTVLIDGDILYSALNKIGIGKYFDNAIFSSDVNVSKPNKKIFDIAYGLHDKLDIVHIGDNAITDGSGAYRYGINYFLINSNSTKITDLFKDEYSHS